MTPLRRLADLIHDIMLSVSVRPVRTLMTLAGILLGMASLVITSGLAASAAANVVATFNQYEATQVTLNTTQSAKRADVEAGVERLRSVPGVSEVGEFAELTLGNVTSARSSDTLDGAVLAATPAALRTIRPTYSFGGGISEYAASSGARVAVIGIGAATQLGISAQTVRPSISIQGLSFAVVGVISDVKRHPSALNEVFIPMSTTERYFGEQTRFQVWIETESGAAQEVGKVAVKVLAPQNVSGWSIGVPPEPASLRNRVASDLGALYLALGGMSLVVGALSIGNTMSVSVLERTTEIGLRRAIGFTRREIVGSFCAEATFLGFLGGLLGSAVGVAAVAVVVHFRSWPLALDPRVLLLCTPIGALIGLVGGLLPAIRAGRMQPAQAVRA